MRDYGEMLRRWLPVILCASVLSGLAFDVSAGLRKPDYAASTRVIAVVAGDAGTPAAFEGGRGAVSQMTSYAALATSALVAARSVDDLQLDEEPSELAAKVSVEVVPRSAIMTVSVVDDDPSRAIASVNAITRNLVNATSELEWSDAGPAASLVPIDNATSAQPVATTSRFSRIASGCVLGLVMSTVLVLGYESARSRLLNRGQVGVVVKRTMSDLGSGSA